MDARTPFCGQHPWESSTCLVSKSHYISAIPTYFTDKANKHLLHDCCVPGAVLGPGSTLEDKTVRVVHFQRVRSKCVRGLKASFPNSSPWQESWLERMLWDCFEKLLGRRPCGKCLEPSQIGSISDPQDQESIQRGLLKEPFIWRSSRGCCSGAWMQSTANRAISVPTRRRLTISGF